MKKKQSKKLLLHKTTVNNLVQIRGGAAVVSQYPTREGCDTKNNTCVRSCKGMVSCLHACNSYPDAAASCYTDPQGIIIEDDVIVM